MEDIPHAAPKTPGWGLALLDAVIAWLLPSVGAHVLRLLIPDGDLLMGALLSLQILAFYMIAKVRGRTGLIRHLTRVVSLIGAVSLIVSRVTLSEGLFTLLVITGCAALGGWVGARRD